MKPENLEDFEETIEAGLGIDTSYVKNETIQSAFLEKMSSSQVEKADEAASPINPIESEEIQEEEETAAAGLAEPIAEEENVATDTIASTPSTLTLPEEQTEPVSPNPINQPIEISEGDENVTEPDQTASILNDQSETNTENTNVINEEVNNSFISNITGDTNLGNVEESVSSVINTISNPADILNKVSSGDVLSTINDISSSGDVLNTINDISSSLGISNLNQSDVLSNIGDTLNTEESFSSITDVFNPTSIKSTIENIKNTVSNQENFEKSSNFKSFPISEIIKPEPVTKEDISKVGENISTGIGSKISNAGVFNQGESKTEPTKSETGQSEIQQPRMERREERSESTGTYVEGTDVSSLERRLKNIELLLQGPLEVKIKN